MARARTATNILEATGAFKKNPNRARPNEPDGRGEFPSEPPAHLTKKEKECWTEIVEMVPYGVLTNSDHLIVEIIAILLNTFRQKKGRTPASVLVRLTSEMNKVGLSPASRAALQVKKEETNPFDEF